MFPRLALAFALTILASHAQDVISDEAMINSLSSAARPVRRAIDGDVTAQLRALRRIRDAMTERDREFIQRALEDGAEHVAGAVGERLRDATSSFSQLRCPEGTRYFVSDRDEDACEFSDGSYDYPLFHRWLERQGEFLFACTYRQGSVPDEGDFEILMCSRLNLLTEELLGRTAEEAVDFNAVGYNVYARRR